MRSSHLIDLLRTRLPGNEVEYAVEDALLEAGAVGENFQGLWGCIWRWIFNITLMGLIASGRWRTRCWRRGQWVRAFRVLGVDVEVDFQHHFHGAYCFWAVEDALLEAGAVGEAFV